VQAKKKKKGNVEYDDFLAIEQEEDLAILFEMQHKGDDNSGNAIKRAVDVNYNDETEIETKRQQSQLNSKAAIYGLKPIPQSQRSIFQVQENSVSANSSPSEPRQSFTGKEYDKKTVVEKTKFANEKFVTTWNYLGTDNLVHCVVLKHNVKTNKQGISKRVVTVDNVEKYCDKSNETKFWVKVGVDKLCIEIITNKDVGFKYELTVNGEKFDNIRREFMKQKASKMSGNI